ncbi:MAG: class I SAM-dependent DNA methyltransferase, partial [Proteobacteria bacterium]|nr:class I SAM-dependent DNA methyltransferase [Pseudomonadota bacterium]
DEDLAAFAYVNGQLFAERTRIPAFDSGLRALLLDCVLLDWSGISPAIFGAMFQSVLEQHQPDQSRTASRRELGAHYTSERNILRAINPLFMDGLRAELQAAGSSRAKLLALYDRLPQLNVFDPACGCGNFLVIAYRELRRLEMELIDKLHKDDLRRRAVKAGQRGGLFDVGDLIRVHVGQCYGIEIDPSAAHIAQVALWITDHQMNLEAASRFGTTRPSVPLVHSPHIRQGNALRTDWAEVLAPGACSFMVGNPPFVGKKEQSKEQKADLQPLTAGLQGAGVLDYVAGWYLKAAAYMQANPAVRTAFVSTNSICQGEQVGILWAALLRQGSCIHFAHRTFKWSNEGKGVAAVHCVIVGFALQAPGAACRLFDYGDDLRGEPTEIQASRINPYLVDAPDVVLLRRATPLAAVPELVEGITPLDNGILAFTAAEKELFLQQEPSAKQWMRLLQTGNDFINGTNRYCLWLSDAKPAELRSMPKVLELLDRVKTFRLESKSSQKFAATPWLFRETTIPKKYLLIPKTSSERRTFLPLGFVENVITTNSALYLESSSLYHFGMLCSTMHNAWMRAVAGRLESRYRYSASVVYNNYPWPSLGDKQQAAIEAAAQGVLDARAGYPDATLADLYDPLTMPAELVR